MKKKLNLAPNHIENLQDFQLFTVLTSSAPNLFQQQKNVKTSESMVFSFIMNINNNEKTFFFF